ncbi:phosphatidylethanolamine-binding protein [Colletotrichum musicola]|uniref:Phosphatidylethanolamine-binding protein n=1 Tax=Colletotrichum musicola TaxID=2175873 RepID=A0A8H6K6I1_9PEZI|nr:phosphatidylethanolamine-binding protein [Colletotrichum musicola]
MKSLSLVLAALLAASSSASPLSVLLIQPSCPNSNISASRAAEVVSKFASARVVPDSVPGITPTVDLRVKYGNIPENLGNEFSALQTLQEPVIGFDPEMGYDPSTTRYTYIQLDPDAPGPAFPLLRQYLHHIIYDIAPSCVPSQTPKTQARYMPLTPLSISPHRYVSLLYRQPAGAYTPPALSLLDDVARAPFDLEKYVQEAGLTLVGGNFMREGLGSSVCGLVPGCTSSGVGYGGVGDGRAIRTDLLGVILNGLGI